MILFLSNESHVYVGGYRHSVPGILPAFIKWNLHTFQYTDVGRNFNTIAKPVRFHKPITTITSAHSKFKMLYAFVYLCLFCLFRFQNNKIPP